MRKNGPSEKTRKHTNERQRIYNIYGLMVSRCYNPSNQAYKDYGGRGIKICQEWLDDRSKFYDWSLANGYKSEYSIDRIDNNKDYCPENCRWTDIYTQANNKRNSLKIFYKGKEQTLKEWCDELELPYKTIHPRITYQKWSPEKAFTTPINNNEANQTKVTFNGETKTLWEFAKDFNISFSTVLYRYEKGLPLEDCFKKETLGKRGFKEILNPDEAQKDKYEYNGDFYYLNELAKLAGLSTDGLKRRLKTMTVKEAVETPNIHKKFVLNGERKSLPEWCKTTGISLETAESRLNRGVPLELAIDPNLSSPGGAKLKLAMKKYLEEHPDYVRVDKRKARKEKHQTI